MYETALDKTKEGENYPLLWNRKWIKTYARYRELAEKLDIEEATKSKDLLHALRIAVKQLDKVENQREELEDEEIPKLW